MNIAPTTGSDVRWEIRFPCIVAFCEKCRTEFIIEFVGPSISIKHCGVQTRLPEKVYERFCEVREMKKTNRPWAPDCRVRSL